jgi:RNA recognition motif-containing protein
MATKSLYVGNLSYSVTESALRELFAEYEPVEVRLIGDKGFGFVDVPEEKAADAIAAMNGREVEGRAIAVSEARPRRERRDTGGGGFGGGGRRRW